MGSNNKKKVIFFDLEMACWDEEGMPKTGEIIEFSLVQVDVGTLTIDKYSQYYVMPDQDELSDFCEHLTGISSGLIKRQGRPLSEVVSTIVKKYGVNKYYYAWGRDDKVINEECKRKGINFQISNFVNYAQLFRVIHGIDGCSQIQGMDIYGLEFQGRQHSGLDDAKNLAMLFIEQTRRFREGFVVK